MKAAGWLVQRAPDSSQPENWDSPSGFRWYGPWEPFAATATHTVWRRAYAPSRTRAAGSDYLAAVKSVASEAGKDSDGKPYSAERVDLMLRNVIANVQGKEVSAVKSTKAASKAIFALWRGLSKPDLANFYRDCICVIEWAQRSPDPLAARDIRGEHDPDWADRSKSLETIFRQGRFAERLAAAQAWRNGGQQPERRKQPKAAVQRDHGGLLRAPKPR